MTRLPRAALPAALLLTADPAVAHSTIEGLNDFYNGVLHPAFVPAHALALLVVGIHLGQRRPRGLEAVLGAFLVAAAVGVVAAGAGFGVELDTALLAAATAVGLLVAADRGVPRILDVAAATAVGAVVGLGSAPDVTGTAAAAVALAGTVLGAVLLLLFGIAANGFFPGKPWQPIAVRVLGSWIAASGLLVLSLRVFAPR